MTLDEMVSLTDVRTMLSVESLSFGTPCILYMYIQFNANYLNKSRARIEFVEFYTGLIQVVCIKLYINPTLYQGGGGGEG